MNSPAPEGPFTVVGYPGDKHDTIGKARIFAGYKQSAGDHRSLQILDARGNVVDLKRF